MNKTRPTPRGYRLVFLCLCPCFISPIIVVSIVGDLSLVGFFFLSLIVLRGISLSPLNLFSCTLMLRIGSSMPALKKNMVILPTHGKCTREPLNSLEMNIWMNTFMLPLPNLKKIRKK